MDTIYIDELFILNLFTDYLIILASARVCGTVLKRRRYLLSALLGALYACAFVLPGCAFLSEPIPKLACGAVMSVISFSPERRPFRCTVVFFVRRLRRRGVGLLNALRRRRTQPISADIA